VSENEGSSGVFRFGAFEVDLSTGELRKRGLRLGLQDQPFQILAALLEHPGQVVTREELLHRLWPEGTFVDFEHSLNASIAKLRQTLGDSASNPRFVETLPRRGYRFIAPVDASNPPFPSAIDTSQVNSSAPESAPPNRRWILNPAVWVPVAVITGAVAMAFTLTISRSAPRPAFTLIRLTSDLGLTAYPAMSKNGALLAYASDRAGNGSLDIWVQQPFPGSQPIQRTFTDADEYEPAFSPDGSRIAYRSEQNGGGVYVISALSGEPQRLAARGRGPQFSPDGRNIVFWRGNFTGPPQTAGYGEPDVFIVPASGGEEKTVHTGLAETSHPVWSPGGNSLLVYGTKGRAAGYPLGEAQSAGDWWIMPGEGGAARPTRAFEAFRQEGIRIAYPESPRPTAWVGNWVYFQARKGDVLNAWRIRLSPMESQVSGPPEQLTFGTGLEIFPSAAATGEFAFASLSRSVNLWRLPADTDHARIKGPLERLTKGDEIDIDPSVSRDGKRLAFVSNRAGGDRYELWMKNTEDGRESLLVGEEPYIQYARISPSGKLVAYTSGDADYIVPVGGGVPQKLCRGCSMIWDWSPDEKLLFLTKRGETGKIYVVDRSSNSQRVLLESGDYLYQCLLSPDRQWVAFLAVKYSNFHLWAAPLSESGPHS